MSKDEDYYSDLATAAQVAADKFNRESIDWISTASVINRYYLQPFESGFVVLVLGGSYGLPMSPGKFVPGAKVESAVVTQAVCMLMCQQLLKQ